MISWFQRPAPAVDALPLFSAEAPGRLARFTPPFRFTSFFAPEDTLLCVVAAEAALGGHIARSPASGPLVVELTAGSGLVGLRLLDLAPTATLLGVDVDPHAPPIARRNAELLGVGGRARFERASVWDPGVDALLAERPIDLLVCNPPYIPEPPGSPLAVEAGAGPDGAAHLRRVAELAERLRPRAVALSWCSLGDPVGVAEGMERAGYTLDALYAVAIADGEYSGLVQPYLETLPTAFLNAAPETRAALAPDGGARFAYVLLAGVWSEGSGGAGRGAEAVARLMRGFAMEGLPALAAADGATRPFAYEAWVLDRWDEVALRAMLHGPATGGDSPGRPLAPRDVAPRDVAPLSR